MVQETKPWETLKDYIEAESVHEIKIYLAQLNVEDVVATISHLNEQQRLKLLSILTPEEAAELIDDIPWAQAAKLIEEMNSKEAAAIISELSSDNQADFLGEIPEKNAEAIMQEMPKEEAENIRELIQYEDDSAGGLMVTEFLSFEEDVTVDKVVKDLQTNSEKYEKYHLQYIYVTHRGQFSGVLDMRTLLLSKPTVKLSEIVLRNALTVKDKDSLESLIKFFDTNDFYGVPVIDDRLQLKGVILRKDLREAQAKQENVEHLETQGIVGGEELRVPCPYGYEPVEGFPGLV